MARKVIKKETKQAVQGDVKIIRSLKPIHKETHQKTLFASHGTASKLLTKSEQGYNQCCHAVKKFLETGKISEISIQEMSYFFSNQYRIVYGVECIDYNIHNCRSTLEKLAKAYRWSEVETLANVAEWFLTYPALAKQLRTESTLTLSVLKKAWITDKLIEGVQSAKFDSFY